VEGLIREAKEALERVFGFADFRPGQREILKAIFAGEDVLAVMPTGSGKSLCYQLPAIVRRGLTIVVSPLIALMRDQVQQLQARGIAAAALNSANSVEDNAAIETGLRRGRYCLLYVAPERLARADTMALLRDAGANVLAIDEAHCVSLWGHDFRPEYSLLAHAARQIGKLQLIAVTATADPPTRADIVKKLFDAEPKIFVRSFDRPNIRLAIARKKDWPRQIEAMVKRHRGKSGIIYCASRKTTEKLCAFLSQTGVPALPYHAGLEAAVRSAHEDEFLHHDGVVIIATIAFGMGIDKPNVRFVAHADLPLSIEAYYQEIGRAGRDGLPAEALTLFSDADILLREQQIPQERKRIERRKLNALIALCESRSCRRQTLLAAFGEDSPPCGNCDVCEGRWPRFGGTAVAYKILPAIRRTSGRIFSGHLPNLLVGRTAGAIKRHAHGLLLAFGAGKELHPAKWRSVFYRLTEEGFDNCNLFAGKTPLTLRNSVDLPCEQASDMQQRAEELERAEANDPEPPCRELKAPKPEARMAALTARQHGLLAILKAKRLEAARREKLPTFAIFHDNVLIEMAVSCPATGEELLLISGVEAMKAERYGPIFLSAIANYQGSS
jgi:ATP-dependent DNA helicase RecQ